MSNAIDWQSALFQSDDLLSSALVPGLTPFKDYCWRSRRFIRTKNAVGTSATMTGLLCNPSVCVVNTVDELFLKRKAYWRSQGLSVRASGVLASAGCNTIAEIVRLGHTDFETRPNCAERTLHAFETIAGWLPRKQTVIDAIAASLALTVPDPVEAREAAADALIALRRSGFGINGVKGARQ